MKYNFKKLKLTNSQVEWLKELYSAFQKDERVNVNHIKRKIWRKLEKDFKPENISDILVNFNNITPIGIYHIDPQTDIFDKIDKVLSSLKELLMEKYNADEIEISDLVAKSKLTSVEVIRLIKIIANSSSSLSQLTINLNRLEINNPFNL